MALGRISFEGLLLHGVNPSPRRRSFLAEFGAPIECVAYRFFFVRQVVDESIFVERVDFCIQSHLRHMVDAGPATHLIPLLARIGLFLVHVSEDIFGYSVVALKGIVGQGIGWLIDEEHSPIQLGHPHLGVLPDIGKNLLGHFAALGGIGEQIGHLGAG